MRRSIAVAAVACIVAAAGFMPPATDSAGRLVAIGKMHELRASHTATLLTNGKVLVVGGFKKVRIYAQEYFSSAELFDPTSGTFELTGSLHTARCGHTATRLPDGSVLVAGGANGEKLRSAEIYDSKTGRFTPAGDMITPREGHTATLLKDGRILIVGGAEPGELRAEIYDPSSHGFKPAGPLATNRVGHTATLLADGKVLIAGGVALEGAGHEVLKSAELFDPTTGRFSATGDMGIVRYKHAAVLTADGKVLVAGGSDSKDWRGQYKSTELYDESTGTFHPAADMQGERFKFPNAVVLLTGGSILLTGGSRMLEQYSGPADRFEVVGQLPEPGYYQTATLLPDGSVLIAGGYNRKPQSTDAAWVFRPAAR